MLELLNKRNICYSLLYLLTLILISIMSSFNIFFFYLVRINYSYLSIISLVIKYKNIINS